MDQKFKWIAILPDGTEWSGIADSFAEACEALKEYTNAATGIIIQLL